MSVALELINHNYMQNYSLLLDSMLTNYVKIMPETHT